MTTNKNTGFKVVQRVDEIVDIITNKKNDRSIVGIKSLNITTEFLGNSGKPAFSNKIVINTRSVIPLIRNNSDPGYIDVLFNYNVLMSVTNGFLSESKLIGVLNAMVAGLTLRRPDNENMGDALRFKESLKSLLINAMPIPAGSWVSDQVEIKTRMYIPNLFGATDSIAFGKDMKRDPLAFINRQLPVKVENHYMFLHNYWNSCCRLMEATKPVSVEEEKEGQREIFL